MLLKEKGPKLLKLFIWKVTLLVYTVNSARFRRNEVGAGLLSPQLVPLTLVPLLV